MDQTNDRNKRNVRNFLIIFSNSLSYFILSFIFMYLFGQFATAIAGLQFDYTSIIYYYKLVYAIDSGAWTPDAVKFLYSITPIIILLVGIISLIIYINMYDNIGHFKIFFLWSFAFSIIWSFGALLAGTILDQGIGYVVMYFYLLDTGKLIISLSALTVVLIVSTLTTKWFLFSANSYFNELNEHNRAFFTYAHILLPLLVGTAIMILIKLPEIRYYELFILLLGLIFGIPVFLKYSNYPTFYFDEFPIKIKLDKFALFAAIIMLIAFRVIFQFGIKFSATT